MMILFFCILFSWLHEINNRPMNRLDYWLCMFSWFNDFFEFNLINELICLIIINELICFIYVYIYFFKVIFFTHWTIINTVLFLWISSGDLFDLFVVQPEGTRLRDYGRRLHDGELKIKSPQAILFSSDRWVVSYRYVLEANYYFVFGLSPIMYKMAFFAVKN